MIPEDRERRTRAAEGGLNLVGEACRLELRRNFFSQREVAYWLVTKGAKMSEFRSLIRKAHTIPQNQNE